MKKLSDIDFPDYPEALILEEGEKILAKYLDADLANEDLPSVQEYGDCIVVQLEILDANPGAKTRLVGERYSLWLTSQLLNDAFTDAADEFGGEIPAGTTVAIQYNGRKTSRTRVDAKGNPQDYASYSVVFPELEAKKPPQKFSWKNAPRRGKKS